MRTLRLAVVIAMGLFAAGCNDDKPVVSLEQAKQITADFQGQGFTPPPRTIADITAILDQEKPDPAKVAALRAAADAEPAAGLSDLELMNFYFNRAGAAARLGRSQQRLADLAECVRLARATRVEMSRYLQQFGNANGNIGNYKRALELWEEAVRIAPDNSARPFFLYQNLAIRNARLGNIAAASRWITEGDRLLQKAQGWYRVYPIFGDEYRAAILQAKGAVLTQTGKYGDAIIAYREAWDAVERSKEKEKNASGATPIENLENWQDFIARDLSTALRLQGRIVEAEVEARRGLLSQLKFRGRYAQDTGWLILNLAAILHEQGRYAEAQRLAEAALDIFQNIGIEADGTPLADARMRIALEQNWRGDWRGALGTYEAVRRGLEKDPETLDRYLGTNNSYAFMLIRDGRAAEALPIIRRSMQKTTERLGPNHFDAAEARGWLGVAYARAKQPERALAELTAVVPTLLTPSREVTDEDTGTAGRDQRVRAIFEAYMGVLADLQGQPWAAGIDVAGEAFKIADALRGGGVQRALTASGARAAATDPALADLVRREQDAQKQVAALQGVLTYVLSGPADQRDPAGLQSMRTQIDTLRGARAAIRQDIERKFPDYVNLIDPRPATIEQAQRSLRPGEALIATYVAQDRSFVWAVPQSGAPAFAAVPITRTDMRKKVADLRRALDPNAATLGEIPAFDTALAYRVYASLLQPVEAGWKSAKSLLVVPHDALGQLPFAVLVTQPAQLSPDREGQALFAGYRSVPFLIRQVAITQLPSVSSLAALRALPAPRGERRAFAGFGDPWFSAAQAAGAVRETRGAELQTRGARTLIAMRGVPLVRRSAPATQSVDSAELAQLPRLPDTADEVRAVAIALNADPVKDVFTGREANERRVRSMDLSDRKVIMFATHGLVPGDLNGLTQPALALSAPSVADTDGDGLLTLDEVLALRLNADWVVLSACNTATGDGAGAEAVSGLGRAFFYAGTRALLVSNWPVETTSARTLTTDLFRRQAQNAQISRAEALRQAEIALIDGAGYVDPDHKATVFSYAHPIFWAPFALVGDGG
ncbi:MAG TPA: CHAT domain-containing protein [Alphaproteobacteria bacterium]